jgi:hypothetical protein
VAARDAAPLPPRAFAAGERVRRATWHGEEEEAEVRAALQTAGGVPARRCDVARADMRAMRPRRHAALASYCAARPIATTPDSCVAGPRAQVVCVESATKRVKVRVLRDSAAAAAGKRTKRKLYTTDAFRLRAAPPAVEDAIPPPAPAPAPAAEEDEDTALTQLLLQRVASLYPSLTDVQLNPRLTQPGAGAGLLRAFRQTVARSMRLDARRPAGAAAIEPHVHLLLHGTPEQNVDSILATSLRGSAYGGNMRWFSNSVDIADMYARGASRRIIFAVFRPQAEQAGYVYPSGGFTIYTLTEDAHHVPLFVARRRVV